MVDISTAITIQTKSGSKRIGASVYERKNRKSLEDEIYFLISLFEFDDNEQFSTLDSFLNQVNPSIIYIPDEYQDSNKRDGKKLSNILFGRNIETVFVKKYHFINSKLDLTSKINKLAGRATHVTNSMEVEMPLAFSCIECLIRSLRLMDNDEHHGRCEFKFDSLNMFLRLNSATSEAVNLLPKPDHPSQFGSIFGI